MARFPFFVKIMGRRGWLLISYSKEGAMKIFRIMGMLVFLLPGFLVASSASAQRKAGIHAAGAGGSSSGNWVLQLDATIGQGIIGRVGNNAAILQQGFWYGLGKSSGAVTGAGGQLHAEKSSLELKAFPNPCSGKGTLFAHIPNASPILIELYDVHGDMVSTLADGLYDRGDITIGLDGSELPSGAYTIIMTAGDKRIARQLQIVR